MNANFAEYVTEEEKEYYIQNYLDEYEPKEFNKILYGLLNYKEKERVVDLEKEVTAEEVNQAFENAGLEGIIEVEHQPLVSVDFNTNPHSAIIDAKSTMVMSGNKVKVIAWYDNEWGYSNRVVDVAEQIGALLTSKETVSAS